MARYGFALHGAISGGELTLSDLQKIKSWGFDYIQPYCWWFQFEPDINQPGVYSEARFQRLRTLVDNAKSVGLKVILALRVSYGGTTGWDVYDADYVNETDEGRQRYANFVEEIVKRFPDCFYCPWHMPYHSAACSSGCIDTFNNVTFPTLLSRVRKHNNNAVVFVPIHQHPKNYPLEPYADSNIVYGVGHVVIGSVSWGKEAWNGVTTEIDNYINLVRDYQRKHPHLEFMSVEYGGIGFIDLPIDETRLECLAYTCQEMGKVNIGWMYHCISKKNPRDTLLADISSFTPEPNLLEILKSSMVEPVEPEPMGENHFLLLFLICLLILGIVLIPSLPKSPKS